MPAPGSMGTAYIRVNVPDNPDIGRKTFNLAEMTSIEVSHYTSLNELPTIVMGYRNNFIIDLGNTRKISLTMKRVNPRSYKDRSSNTDDWSNGKWYRELEAVMDYWQNFGKAYNNDDEWTGGFEFHFIPSDSQLAASMSYNVFLSGALNLQYSTQYMVVQMNLTVARMGGESSGPTPSERVTLILNPSTSMFEPVEREVQADVTVAVPTPPWDYMGYAFRGWSYTQGSTTVDLPAGGTTMFGYQTSPIELWAVWNEPIGIWVSTDHLSGAGSTSFTTPSGTTSITVYAVGGGGGGGSGGWNTIYEGGRSPGGGGGSGEFVIGSLPSGSNRTYNVTIGAGGAGGGRPTAGLGKRDGNAGGNGDSTTVQDASLPQYRVTALGGLGGPGGNTTGAVVQGGQSNGKESYRGGNAQYGVDGGDGQTSASNAGNEGKGGPHRGGNMDWGGGAGGGAAGFHERFYVNDRYYPADGYYMSIGGNGADAGNSDNHPTEGQCGGGGGSCDYTNGDAAGGGDGMVIVLFFRE